MHIKKYIAASFALIGLVWLYVNNYMEHTTKSIDFFGYYQTPELPLAIWIIIPMAVLFIASFFHMAFFSFLGSILFSSSSK